MTVLTPANAFPNLAFPQHGHGVGLDAVGTEKYTAAGTSATYTGITVGTGANRALVVLIDWATTTLNPTGRSVIWDSGGTNQVMTEIAFKASGSNGSAGVYGLVGPTSGNKTLAVSWTGSNETFIAGISFTGVDQTGGTTSFPNATTGNTGILSIPNVSGNCVVGCASASPNNTSQTGIVIFNDTTNGAIANAYAEYYFSSSTTVNFGNSVGNPQAIAAAGVQAIAVPNTNTVQSFTYPGAVWPNVNPPPPAVLSAILRTSPPTWTPLSLANIVGFWRADAGVTQSAGSVSSWADQSGSGNTLTGAGGSNNPGFSSTTWLGAYPGISFTSAQSFANTNFTFASSSLWSLFMLMTTTLNQAFNVYCKLLASGDSLAFSGVHSFQAQEGSNTAGPVWETYNNSIAADTGPMALISPYLVGSVMDGTNLAQWINSLRSGATIPGNTIGVAPNTFTVGSGFTGTLAFMGITRAQMAAADWANLLIWSNLNFGTNFLLPAGSIGSSFPGKAFPQHKSGQTNTVQDFLYSGAVQPQVFTPAALQLMMQSIIQM